MSGIYVPNVSLPGEEDFELWIAVKKDGSFTYNARKCWHDGKQKVIAVPDHGRLIQDNALDKIEHYHDGIFGLTDYERGRNAALLLCKKHIEAAPTIIPAEEEMK